MDNLRKIAGLLLVIFAMTNTIAKEQYEDVELFGVNILTPETSLQSLREEIRIATEDNIKSRNKYVDGLLNGQKIKLRLKGLLSDHWSSDLGFSMTIKRDSQKKFSNGSQEISLMRNVTRESGLDFIFINYLHANKILGVRKGIADVSLNNEKSIRMEVEYGIDDSFFESFSKHKLASVIKLSEKEMVSGYLQFRKSNGYGSPHPHNVGPYYNFWIASPKVVYQSNSMAGERATWLLKKFQLGEISADKVFDLDYAAKFYVLSKKWGADHALTWNNVLLGYDAFKDKFIFIASDTAPDLKIKFKQESLIFQDFENFKPFNDSVKKYDEYFNENYREQIKIVEKIHNDYSQYFPGTEINFEQLKKNYLFDLSKIKGNAYAFGEYIFADNYEKWINLFVFQDGAYDYLYLQNILDQKINLDLQINNCKISDFPKKITLPPTKLGERPKSYRIRLMKDSAYGDCKISYIAKSESNNFESRKVFKISHYKQVFDESELAVGQIQGSLVINRPTRIVHDVYIKGGTQLSIKKNAYLRILGDVKIGNHNDLYVLVSGPGGIILAGNKINIKNLKFSHVQDAPNLMTGALNIEGAGSLSNVELDDIDTADAVNIANSNFALSKISLRKIKGDGLDVDFGDYDIREVRGSNIGGDLIDLSGVRASITDVFGSAIADKGISVGESSKVILSNLHIDNANIGIACKDNSNCSFYQPISLKMNRYELLSYVKKKYYKMPSLINGGTKESLCPLGDHFYEYKFENAECIPMRQAQIPR